MTGHFRSFRSRLVVVFLGLFVVIQATGYVAVAAFVRTSARQHVEEELRLATTLFARQLDERGRQLVAATRLLSGDFALKTAAATADRATTASMLENHRRRADADILVLAALDGAVVGDTQKPSRLGSPFPAPRLIAEAEAGHDVSDVVAIDGRLYRLAVVPLLAPETAPPPTCATRAACTCRSWPARAPARPSMPRRWGRPTARPWRASCRSADRPARSTSPTASTWCASSRSATTSWSRCSDRSPRRSPPTIACSTSCSSWP